MSTKKLPKNLEKIKEHYLERGNIELRIKLATEGFTGKLITYNFKKIVNLAKPYKSNEKIIDVGCGFGYLLHFLPSNINLYAYDISPLSLKFARNFRKKFIAIRGDAHNMNCENNTFDKLFSINLTPHLSNVNKALKEFYRVLKPGGLAVINLLNKYCPTSIPFTIFGLKYGYYFKYNILTPSKQQNFGYFKSKKLVEKAGFKILQTYGTGIPFPYSLGQKLPKLANIWTDITIKTEDLPIMKQLSSTIVFKLQKPLGR